MPEKTTPAHGLLQRLRADAALAALPLSLTDDGAALVCTPGGGVRITAAPEHIERSAPKKLLGRVYQTCVCHCHPPDDDALLETLRACALQTCPLRRR